MRKTKIVCTMGPATDKEQVLMELIQSGMNVARFNFSHGSHEEQRQRMEMLKKLRRQCKKPVAMLLDTKGPEIRTGIFQGGKAVLEPGQQFTLTCRDIIGNSTMVAVTYPKLYEDEKPGNRILIDDGLVELEVQEVRGEDIICKVVTGGVIFNHKGVNVPNVSVGLPDVTEKDKEDILFGITQGFDFIAASFVRSAECIRTIRNLLKENNGTHIQIIAKIENAEGVENIDEILKEADGIMVARGDLGVEIPADEVPYIQKQIITKCNEHLKPVITATQMLDSMIRNPRPTRAEAGDVANAIYDGTDAIMLSGETAMGKYPLEAVRMMAKIAETTEEHLDYETHFMKAKNKISNGISEAVGYAAVSTAIALNADCIITPTFYGQTARLIAHFRPKMPIYGVSPHDRAMRRMQLYWGVYPYKGMMEESSSKIMKNSLKVLKEKGKVQKDDLVVFTAGDAATNDVSGKSMTNMMNVVVVK